MDRYHGRWEQEGKAWKPILDHIQPTVDLVAKSLGAGLSRERGEAPELDVQWYSDDIGRAIQILIVGTPKAYELQINGSAWKDSDSPRERRWRAEDALVTIPLPEDIPQLDVSALEHSLTEVGAIVSGWDESSLVNRDDLPPRPPNVTGGMVGGRYVP